MVKKDSDDEGSKALAREFEKKVEIQWLNPKSLKPYKKNAKKHPAEQIDSIAHQITEFGWDQPIVVDEDLVIIKGHGRQLAALKLKLAVVPVIVRKGFSKNDRRAMRLGDNRVAESDYDVENLKDELRELNEEGVDLEDTGFDLDEAEALLDDVPPREEKRPKVSDTQQWIVSVHCQGEKQMQDLFEEMKKRGLECKLIT